MINAKSVLPKKPHNNAPYKYDWEKKISIYNSQKLSPASQIMFFKYLSILRPVKLSYVPIKTYTKLKKADRIISFLFFFIIYFISPVSPACNCKLVGFILLS